MVRFGAKRRWFVSTSNESKKWAKEWPSRCARVRNKEDAANRTTRHTHDTFADRSTTSSIESTRSPERRKIWFDCDIMNGNPDADQDDGFALCALLHSGRVDVVGLSSVWGNGSVDETHEKLVELTRLYFGTSDADDGTNNAPPVYRGCSRPIEYHAGEAAKGVRDCFEEAEAVAALARTLEELPDGETLTIVAVGPLTNVGAVVLQNPHLVRKIDEVVVCAGRAGPGDRFLCGTKQELPFLDMNFDFDPNAFQIMLQMRVPLVLAGWQISTALWLEHDDLIYLHKQGKNELIRKVSNPENCDRWLELWRGMGHQLQDPTKPIDGFHPFDLLTASYVFFREGVEVEDRAASIVIGHDDRLPDRPTAFKYYLAAPHDSCGGGDSGHGSRVKFVTDAVDREAYKARIMQLLVAPEE